LPLFLTSGSLFSTEFLQAKNPDKYKFLWQSYFFSEINSKVNISQFAG